MLTPNGQPANKMEKVILLNIWTHALEKEMASHDQLKAKKMISAGIGKPTYPINAHTILSFLSYWQKMDDLTKKWRLNPEEIQENSAIDYGDPRGDNEPIELMAKLMSAWYESEIKPEHVLFTVGGIGALRIIFETLNSCYEDTPGYRVITPFPHYSVYSTNPLHRLHPIDVMKEPGYRLTAAAIEASIKEAYSLAETDHGWPKAILICNPSNPLGSVIDEEELNKIAHVLRQYPDLHILFDEAYAEMCYVKMPSFLKIAPDLKSRIVIMRSATKALSAAGERMAVLLVFEQTLMHEMLNKNINYFIHAPRSAQFAYAHTMSNFDVAEQKSMTTFYKNKVDYVIKRLHEMGAAMPDPQYQVEATFYALGNFSDLLGLEMPEEAYRALQKTGKVSTGEELAYYLLFKDAVMIAPLSFFGLAKDSGFIRITCSGNAEELKELMDRLEHRLLKARKNKKLTLLDNINQKLPELKNLDAHLYEIISNKIAIYTHEEDNCLTLKIENQALERLQSSIVSFFD